MDLSCFWRTLFSRRHHHGDLHFDCWPMPFPPQMLFIRPRDGLYRVPLCSLRNNSRSLHDYRALARIGENVVCGITSLQGREGLPAEGLEPTRSCDHWILSPARLPIPPRRRRESEATKVGRKLKRFSRGCRGACRGGHRYIFAQNNGPPKSVKWPSVCYRPSRSGV